MAIISLLVLTGMCAFAALMHLAGAFRNAFDLRRLLLAGLCLIVVGQGISQAMAYEAYDLELHLRSLRANLTLICLFYMLFPWFVRSYSGIGNAFLLAMSTAAMFGLLILNLQAELTLQFETVAAIEVLQLPWGETIAQVTGQSTRLIQIGIALVVMIIIYSAVAMFAVYRQRRTFTAAAMFTATLIFFIGIMQGSLVRLGFVNFLHLGPFAFLLTMVIVSAAWIRETSNRLTASELRFRGLVEQAPFSIQIFSPDGSSRQVNHAWEELWGITAETIKGYCIHDDKQLSEKGVLPYLHAGLTGTPTNIPPIVYNPADNPNLRGPQRDRWIDGFAYAIRDPSGAISDVILLQKDVTESRRMEDAIQLVSKSVSSANDNTFYEELIVNLAQVFDAQDAFVALLSQDSPAECSMLARSVNGQVAEAVTLTLDGSVCAAVLEQNTVIQVLNVQKQYPDDAYLSTCESKCFTGAPLQDKSGHAIGLIVLVSAEPLEDNEQGHKLLKIFALRVAAELQRQQAEASMRHMAYHDFLTGLPNRSQLYQWLESLSEQASESHCAAALLLIDLDHFKTINDALGHDVGDRLLALVARRLESVRGANTRLAHIGGDEFVVLLVPHPDVQKKVARLAEQILHSFSGLVVADRNFNLGASIGIAFFPVSGGGQADVLRHAELALYQAKRSGRGAVRAFQSNLETDVASRLQLEEGLRVAIASKQLSLSFQPQFNVSGEMTGAEALLRWKHPKLGEVSPTVFIPVAEETGAIQQIGAWVLDEACRLLSNWSERGLALGVPLSVNVSGWQFSHPDFIQMVQETLARHQVQPDQLTLELTESALLYDITEAIARLKSLRQSGFRISLDDFGTGYSSLAHLRDLPLDQLKIDQSFIANLRSTDDSSMIESILDIGRNMGLEVVAEGVEIAEHRSRLIQLGCHSFQGYLLCRPLTLDKFEAYLRTMICSTIEE